MITKEWKPINTKLVVNNIKNIIKSKDIYKMTKATYNVLYLMSGFIAHYNHQGFMDHYQDVDDLISDLLRSSDLKRPDYYLEAYFQKDDHSKKYYTSKSETYRAIEELLKTN